MHKIKTKASSNTCSAKNGFKGNPLAAHTAEAFPGGSVKHRTTLLECVGLTSTKTRSATLRARPSASLFETIDASGKSRVVQGEMPPLIYNRHRTGAMLPRQLQNEMIKSYHAGAVRREPGKLKVPRPDK